LGLESFVILPSDAGFFGKKVQCQKPSVMEGFFVLGTWIAEADE
jgi:hypothetical protein